VHGSKNKDAKNGRLITHHLVRLPCSLPICAGRWKETRRDHASWVGRRVRAYKRVRVPAWEPHLLHPPTFLSLALEGLPISFSSPSLAPLERPCISRRSFWSPPFQWRRWLACTLIGILDSTVQDITTWPEPTNTSCRTSSKARHSLSKLRLNYPCSCLSLIGSSISADGISLLNPIPLTETCSTNPRRTRKTLPTFNRMVLPSSRSIM
jgi:hypothetical protein